MQTEDIRQATPADLASVADIWYQASVSEEVDPPPLGAVPSLYLHELECHELFVLERGGRVVAFAALINRGPVAFLADLFVATNHRSTGLGQRLLRRILPRDGRIVCTLSSDDPRALPLYVRFGLSPCLPQLQLRADLGRLGALAADDVEVIEADGDDPELLRWDAEISGRRRPRDYAYWLRRRGGVPLWFSRRGELVGYAVAQTRSDDLLRRPDTVTLGPIGSRGRAESVACALAAVRWARERATLARISITGPHPALAPLLAAGFRIAYLETFCSTTPEPFVDVQRYISSGSDLF